MLASGPVAKHTYDRLAPFYDVYNRHPAYASWIEGLARLGEEAGAPSRTLLDVACGTGRSFVALLETGYAVCGVDISVEMLKRAESRAPRRARLVACDMTALPFLGRFGLAFCVNDALNYLLRPDEVGATLRGIAANLSPGGIAVFDTNTLATFRGVFATTRAERRDGFEVMWRGGSDSTFAAGGEARASMTVTDMTAPAGRPLLTVEHRQRHHPQEVVREAIQAAGLECVAIHGQHDDGRRDPRLDEAKHTKAIWVARRPSRVRG